MSLEDLLDRAGVDRMNRHNWFSRCTLSGTSLLVHDIDDYGCIERCWLTLLREVLPVEITFTPKAKPQVQRSSVFKKGSPPWQAEQDLLD